MNISFLNEKITKVEDICDVFFLQIANFSLSFTAECVISYQTYILGYVTEIRISSLSYVVLFINNN